MEASLGTFPNREEGAAALRAFLGALPVTWMAILVLLVLFVAWWTEPAGIVPLVLLAVAMVALVCLAVYGLSQLRAGIPTRIEITAMGIRASWPRGSRPDLVLPFADILSVEAREWRWTHGKGAYAAYVPPSIHYRPPPETPIDEVGDGNELLLYITEENADRIRRAQSFWNAGGG